MAAPPETLIYVALHADAGSGARDSIGVIDADASSPTFGRLVGRTTLPQAGNGLRRFGWNACRSQLRAAGSWTELERRYLIVPGTQSSRIHILDIKPDPRNPIIVKVIEADEVARKTGYTALHSVRRGPDGIYMNGLGAADGNGPGGIFLLDEHFEIRGPWETDRGPQYLAYDFWWHLGHNTMITSEWGTPTMVNDGVNLEKLFAGKYGRALHVWDLKMRRHVQALDLGAEQQMVLELRPAHNPARAYGFAGVVMSLKDLSSSIFLWYLDRKARDDKGEWKAKKVITIPAEPVHPDQLPPVLAGFTMAPPLVTDINLSLDDRFLYVSCWGTGKMLQYDVSDPFNPALTGAVRIGGMVRRAAHPANPSAPLSGGPQMVEISRDGKRVYVTNSFYSPWDSQFYPEGLRGWMVKFDVGRDGGFALDKRFLVEFEDGICPRQVRLEGGDASSDSFCSH